MQKEKEVRESPETRLRMDAQERLEKRIAEIEGRGYSMSYRDSTHINKDNIPWGWEYRWGRQHCRGYVDDARMAELFSAGWTCVPPERHPEIVPDAMMGSNGSAPTYIYKNGLVLLERPEKFGRMDREFIHSHNRKLMDDMPGISNLLGEPSIPVSFQQDPRARSGPSSF